MASARGLLPQWDPTDGDDGNWNSQYDSVTLRGATHVWADHNTFTDAGHFDSANPKYYGREYQVHDGELDITKSSEIKTTVNWTPTLTAGLEPSARNLPTELAKTTGAGVLTAS